MADAAAGGNSRQSSESRRRRRLIRGGGGPTPVQLTHNALRAGDGRSTRKFYAGRGPSPVDDTAVI